MNNDSATSHPILHLSGHISSKLNWLRAAVLGADDGIVSIAGLVVGVASATSSQAVIITAGVAGIVAGMISMAAGEYVSVSSSRDTEKVLLDKERYELKHNPEQELEELAEIYEKKGLKKETAILVAKELTVHDAMAAHFDAELGIDPKNLTNPWHAALASATSYLCGGVIPMVAIIIPPASSRIPVTFVAVIIALALTGVISAKVSGASTIRSTFRVILGGTLAMLVTYGIGQLIHISGM